MIALIASQAAALLIALGVLADDVVCTLAHRRAAVPEPTREAIAA